MGKKMYNSAADRRWQQRYQRITERKELNSDIETPRDERRRQKKTLYSSAAINIDRMLSGKVAVVCSDLKHVRQIFWAVNIRYPNFTKYCTLDGLEASLYFTSPVAAMGIISEDFWFETETYLRLETIEYFQNRGFEIIDFYELIPVRDLGNIQPGAGSIDQLFDGLVEVM